MKAVHELERDYQSSSSTGIILNQKIKKWRLETRGSFNLAPIKDKTVISTTKEYRTRYASRYFDRQHFSSVTTMPSLRYSKMPLK
jgi:hypothetical protein